MISARALALALSSALGLATTAAPVAAVESGESLYGRCAACHSFEYNRTGPRHCGLFGRKAGTEPGYEYSKAMRGAGIVWNEETLDRFLAAPTKVVPGTTMTYAGVPDAEERKTLIAYLKEKSTSGECAAR